MPVFNESLRSPSRVRKGILSKHGRSNSNPDLVLNSLRSKTLSSSEDSDNMRDISMEPNTMTSRDNNSSSTSLISKIRNNFNFCRPPEQQNGAQNGGREVKVLSPSEARALTEFGKHLSEKNNDHQGAIVTLMRALKTQISSQGALNRDCATTLTYMGDVYMRRGGSSKDEEGTTKDAKRAEFCFSEAIDVYRYYNEKRSIAKLTKRLSAAKRLQMKKRRVVSFSLLPQREHSQSTISTSDSSDIGHDKTVVSDITWMDAYNSDYYKKQHLLFLEKQHHEESRLLNFIETGICSYFCRGPPVNNIEFVERKLDL